MGKGKQNEVNTNDLQRLSIDIYIQIKTVKI